MFPDTHVYCIAGVDYCGEYKVELKSLLSNFPDLRFFSVSTSSFLEYDRNARVWNPISFEEIYP